MAKKDFKGNPAMSFISQASIDKVDREPAGGTTPMGKRHIPDGFKIDPRFIETKSKRVQLLIQPSLHSEAKAAAESLGISLNDFISRAIQEATRNDYVKEQIKKDLEG